MFRKFSIGSQTCNTGRFEDDNANIVDEERGVLIFWMSLERNGFYAVRPLGPAQTG